MPERKLTDAERERLTEAERATMERAWGCSEFPTSTDGYHAQSEYEAFEAGYRAASDAREGEVERLEKALKAIKRLRPERHCLVEAWEIADAALSHQEPED